MPKRLCLYCDEEKDESSFSLEHVIPQFLGGTFSPDKFKTRDVCKNCNSNLGLFVDASFAKDHLVNHSLVDNSFSFFDPNITTSLPLRCLGTCELELPGLQADEICEFWLGPLGEQVYWVRPNDERLYWYVGGNPRNAKQFQTKAYYIFSERAQKNINLSLNSFVASFKKQKIKKILCTKTNIADLSQIGFSEPDENDIERIIFFNSISNDKNKLQFSSNIKFDHRFLAKLSLGISYCMYGAKILNNTYTCELRKGLWYKENDPLPELLGTTNLGSEEKYFKELMGIEGAVAICFIVNEEGLGINLNIRKRMNWTVLATPLEIMSQEEVAEIGNGRILLLFRDIEKCIETDLLTFIAHKNNSVKIDELSEIEFMIDKNKDYFKNL